MLILKPSASDFIATANDDPTIPPLHQRLKWAFVIREFSFDIDIYCGLDTAYVLRAVVRNSSRNGGRGVYCAGPYPMAKDVILWPLSEVNKALLQPARPSASDGGANCLLDDGILTVRPPVDIFPIDFNEPPECQPQCELLLPHDDSEDAELVTDRLEVLKRFATDDYTHLVYCHSLKTPVAIIYTAIEPPSWLVLTNDGTFKTEKGLNFPVTQPFRDTPASSSQGRQKRARREDELGNLTPLADEAATTPIDLKKVEFRAPSARIQPWLPLPQSRLAVMVVDAPARYREVAALLEIEAKNTDIHDTVTEMTQFSLGAAKYAFIQALGRIAAVKAAMEDVGPATTVNSWLQLKTFQPGSLHRERRLQLLNRLLHGVDEETIKCIAKPKYDKMMRYWKSASRAPVLRFLEPHTLKEGPVDSGKSSFYRMDNALKFADAIEILSASITTARDFDTCCPAGILEGMRIMRETTLQRHPMMTYDFPAILCGTIEEVNDADGAKIRLRATGNKCNECGAPALSNTFARRLDTTITVRLAHVDAPESSQPFASDIKACMKTLYERKHVIIQPFQLDAFERHVVELYTVADDGDARDKQRGWLDNNPDGDILKSGLFTSVIHELVLKGWCYVWFPWAHDVSLWTLQTRAREAAEDKVSASTTMDVSGSRNPEADKVFRERLLRGMFESEHDGNLWICPHLEKPWTWKKKKDNKKKPKKRKSKRRNAPSVLDQDT